MTYRFFYKELQWKFQNSDGEWLEQNPPLPTYAEKFSAVEFVQIWKFCRYMNDAHRMLFWLSKQEIDNYFEEINLALQECGYQLLPPLKYATQGIFSDEDLLFLEEKGCIEKTEILDVPEDLQEPVQAEDNTEETSTMTALYNQMKKKKNTYDPLRHIFTTEGGKFSVRH